MPLLAIRPFLSILPSRSDCAVKGLRRFINYKLSDPRIELVVVRNYADPVFSIANRKLLLDINDRIGDIYPLPDPYDDDYAAADANAPLAGWPCTALNNRDYELKGSYCDCAIDKPKGLMLLVLLLPLPLLFVYDPALEVVGPPVKLLLLLKL